MKRAKRANQPTLSQPEQKGLNRTALQLIKESKWFLDRSQNVPREWTKKASSEEISPCRKQIMIELRALVILL